MYTALSCSRAFVRAFACLQMQENTWMTSSSLAVWLYVSSLTWQWARKKLIREGGEFNQNFSSNKCRIFAFLTVWLLVFAKTHKFVRYARFHSPSPSLLHGNFHLKKLKLFCKNSRNILHWGPLSLSCKSCKAFTSMTGMAQSSEWNYARLMHHFHPAFYQFSTFSNSSSCIFVRFSI